jgi:glyoxylase-like metal-dependent hydrolase (beta-lactamase superfamily II)
VERKRSEPQGEASPGSATWPTRTAAFAERLRGSPHARAGTRTIALDPKGDQVAGFRVIDVPGHSRGHIALFREADRVLILGDVLNSADPLTGARGLRIPKDFFTPDPQRNRESARRLGELEPSIVAFGHGPPVRDTKKFLAFCRAL